MEHTELYKMRHVVRGGAVRRRERSAERWKLRRCSESMCLSHLHPLGSMFFNLISRPGLCVAVCQRQRLKVRSSFRGLSRNIHSCWYSITAQPHSQASVLSKASSGSSQCVFITHTHALITLMHAHYGLEEYFRALHVNLNQSISRCTISRSS